ncbi:16413_t:CDS:1, partial [Racocetra fulgida]
SSLSSLFDSLLISLIEEELMTELSRSVQETTSSSCESIGEVDRF